MDNDTAAALKQIHEQLQRVQALDDSDRALVRQLQADIQSILASGKTPSSAARPLHEQLQDAIQRFEVTHPELTIVMARVINQLGDLGI